MTRPRRAVRVAAAYCGVLLFAFLVPMSGALVAAPGAHAVDDKGDTGNLSVSVTDGTTPSPTPTPSPTSTHPGNGNGNGNGNNGNDNGNGGGNGSNGNGNGGNNGGGNGNGNNGNGNGNQGAPQTTPNEVSAGGGIYVGGLMSSSAPSLNPAEGIVTLWFSVRNESQGPIDATARFWMDSVLLGIRVDEAAEIPVAALQSGETRVVTAQLRNGGQWTVLNAHATLTPPETVDGAKTTPITRDATVLLFPWVLTTGGIVAGVTVALLILGRGLFAARFLVRTT